MKVEEGCGWILYNADWLDVELPSVDAVIEDPPYSARTHDGHHSKRGAEKRRDLAYDHIDEEDVEEIVVRASQLCDGWCLWMTSHDLIPAYERAADTCALVKFAPVPIVIPGMTVRFAGDGPSSWAVYMMVTRPKKRRKWGTKDGAYIVKREAMPVVGSKPLGLMETIVRDYTNRGETVLDRFAGAGTTGVAALRQGRKFIGCEQDPKRFALAARSLASTREQLKIGGIA